MVMVVGGVGDVRLQNLRVLEPKVGSCWGKGALRLGRKSGFEGGKGVKLVREMGGLPGLVKIKLELSEGRL